MWHRCVSVSFKRIDSGSITRELIKCPCYTNLICSGLLCRELAPHCKQIVGVDISQGMVDVFNTRVANQGIDPDEMKAVCLDLRGAEGELEGVKFDVVVVSSCARFVIIVLFRLGLY